MHLEVGVAGFAMQTANWEVWVEDANSKLLVSTISALRKLCRGRGWFAMQTVNLEAWVEDAISKLEFASAIFLHYTKANPYLLSAISPQNSEVANPYLLPPISPQNSEVANPYLLSAISPQNSDVDPFLLSIKQCQTLVFSPSICPRKWKFGRGRGWFAMQTANWEAWVEDAISKLGSQKLLLSARPINLRNVASKSDALEVFEGLHQWDRTTVHVKISERTFHKWLNDIPSCGETAIDDVSGEATEVDFNSQPHRMLLLFSGNDFLALSSHPAIRMAAAKAAQDYGMGPRGSAVNCGYTDFHWLLEARLAALKKKEDCLLCPTGFSANMALIVAIGSVASLSASTKRPSRAEKVAVFSDALNHASIIDGLLLAERQNCIEVFVYRHCDMHHLNALLSECTMEKKVVMTDSIFSMDGDFAPIDELAKLRKKHGFLLVIDDAHGTFVCGKHGGGVAEVFNCEKDVDICIGTLSKGAGCFGGFIACSKKWKQLIQSRGRSFIFSTSLPVPVVAAAHAAVIVSEKEMWRRRVLLERLEEFRNLTGIPVTSHIISLVVGSEERALLASRHLLQSGFHVTPIRPPAVPPNSCRLRVALSTAHTRDDINKLAIALSPYINCDDSPSHHPSESHAKL